MVQMADMIVGLTGFVANISKIYIPQTLIFSIMKLGKRGELGKEQMKFVVWIILSIIVLGVIFFMIISLKKSVLP